MPTKARSKKPARNPTLSMAAVTQLADVLFDLADTYPAVLRTEVDFYPAVYGYLRGLFQGPDIKPEYGDRKKVDFRIGGTNPALLELAVRPRHLVDENDRVLALPGINPNNGKPYSDPLAPSQNRTEITKLMDDKVNAKSRVLLLLDLGAPRASLSKLKTDYEAKLGRMVNAGKAVRVHYLGRGHDGTRVSISFMLPGKGTSTAGSNAPIRPAPKKSARHP